MIIPLQSTGLEELPPPPVEVFYWIGGIIAALATMGYWLAPLVALLRPARLGARAPSLGYVRTRSLLPLPLEAALDRHDAPLRKAGFEPCPPVRELRDLNKARGGTSGVAQLFRHPGNGDTAALIVTPKAPNGATAVLHFSTRLADGTTLETCNMPAPIALPAMRGTRRLRFEGELAPPRLYALHRARVAESGPAAPQPFDDALAAMHALEQRSLDWMVECGYMRRSGDRLRPTIRGAFAGACRRLPPWSWLERRHAERERRRLTRAARLPTSHGNERSLASRVLFE